MIPVGKSHYFLPDDIEYFQANIRSNRQFKMDRASRVERIGPTGQPVWIGDCRVACSPLTTWRRRAVFVQEVDYIDGVSRTDRAIAVRVAVYEIRRRADTDQLQLFGPSNDDPANQGSNGSSYYNPEFVRLAIEANSVPGCDPAKRAEIYAQIQQLLQDDQPYLWLYVQNLMYAAGPDVAGFDAQPNLPLWNVSTWKIRTP